MNLRVVEVVRRAEGGMKKHFLRLVKGLKSTGFDVLAVCNFDLKIMEELESLGVNVYPFEIEDQFKLSKDIKAIVRLYHIIKFFKADVLHCHGFKAGIIGRMACLLAGCPCVYTIHNFLPVKSLSRHKLIFFSLIEKVLSGFTYAIIAVSQALKDDLVKQVGLIADKIRVVYCGIDEVEAPAAENIRRQWGISADALVVGSIARLVPLKGLDYLLEAFSTVHKKTQSIKLLIVGDGPYMQALRSKASVLNLNEKVIFTGFIENIADYLEAIDIFVLPSISEGLGISALEAMMAGKPVIATRVGGIPEIVHDRVSGHLVEPSNAEQIAQAILYFASNPEIMKMYGSNGRKYVAENFSVSKMVDETADILKNSVNRSSL